MARTMSDELSEQEKAYVFQQWEHHKATMVKEYILQHYPRGTLERKEQHERNHAKWLSMVQAMLTEGNTKLAITFADYVALHAAALVMERAWYRQLMEEVMTRIPNEARIFFNGRLMVQKKEDEE